MLKGQQRRYTLGFLHLEVEFFHRRLCPCWVLVVSHRFLSSQCTLNSSFSITGKCKSRCRSCPTVHNHALAYLASQYK
ncbi:hypothetical protein Hanom_Chr14g01293791 [Helianthus anomalus]